MSEAGAPGPRSLGPRAAELAAAVSERELLRLLGMPRGRALEGDLRARARHARAWYAAHARPFAVVRRVGLASLETASVRLEDGTELRSRALAAALRAARSHAVVALAVSAGREAPAEASRLWADRPDEAYVLDRFATAATEALVLWAAGLLCREAAPSGETLLPPRSPGCGDFAIGDQQRLARVLGAVPSGGGDDPEARLALGPLELLPTGALDPPQTLLAALGVTRQPLVAATPEDLCRSCALEPCGFRRAPFALPDGAARSAPGLR